MGPRAIDPEDFPEFHGETGRRGDGEYFMRSILAHASLGVDADRPKEILPDSPSPCEIARRSRYGAGSFTRKMSSSPCVSSSPLPKSTEPSNHPVTTAAPVASAARLAPI